MKKTPNRLPQLKINVHVRIEEPARNGKASAGAGGDSEDPAVKLVSKSQMREIRYQLA